MLNLINALDNYKDFNSTAYFVLCFNKLPSNLLFEAPLKGSKESIEKVIQSFDFQKLQLQEIFKDWSTSDDKDADSSKDFPYQLLFKSELRSLIIWISLRNNKLFVEFLYDVAEAGLEQEVIAMSQDIRTIFGTNKAPAFKVLTYESNYFDTREVKSEFLAVNIDEYYNDDFQEVNTIIQNSLDMEKSGLVLLHGIPGTGKTTYIKNLISKFEETSFIFIQNEFVKDLLKPDFISFLINHRNSVLIIEDAEKVITTRENLGENSLVSTILQLTDGLFSDFLNIKIICTFNTNIEKVDKALLRKGRLIASYEFKPLSVEKSNKLLQAMGHPANNTEMALSDIFNYDKRSFEPTDNKKKIGFF